MSTEAVARRYARAIFELGKEQGQLEPLRRELESFADVYRESEELRSVVGSPLLADQSRDAVVEELGRRLQAGPLTLNLVRLLGRRRRLAVLPDLVRHYGEMVDEHLNVARATVKSASKLSPAYLERLKGKLEQSLGKKVIIRFEEDPTLIAGVVTQIGDIVVDGSVRGKLDRLRESLRQS